MLLECLSRICRAIAPGLGHRIRQSALIAIVAETMVFSLASAPPIRAQSPPTSSPPTPTFEVASIKPNKSGSPGTRIMIPPGKVTVSGITLKQFIAIAYHVRDFQVSGGPSWINSDRYDIDAKAEDSVVEELRKLPPEEGAKQMGLMVQSLLADRFQLKVSHTLKDLPVYALVIAKNGPKLHEANPGDTYPNGIKGLDGVAHPGMMRMGRGQLTGQALPMGSLVMLLSQQLGRTILDQTGLKGKYDFELQWTPDQGQGAMLPGPPGGGPGADSPPPPDASGPSIFTAIQEQLGLKLESTKGPVDILVIDHIEKPSEN